MDIAYLVNQYPSISHSFIRREIQALERQGVSIHRFSIRPAKQSVIADEDKTETERTRYIVGAPIVSLIRALTVSFLNAPLKSIAVFAQAMRMGACSDAGLPRHVLYWVEAMVLAAWLRAGDLAHVHVHFGTNSATVAMLAARIGGLTYSMTVHGPEEFDKAHSISLAEKVEAAAFTCAVASFGLSQLRRLVSLASWPKIHVIRCGIDRSFLDAAAAPAPAAARFAWVGRLCEQKGLITLVDAAALLKKRGVDFTIVLAGDGELRSVIEERATALGVSDRITITGWRTPAEVRSEIEKAKVFLAPSYAEGLPVSIMEALCLERPVISTYVAGIPELVRPDENGWLVPAGDAAALANAMAEAAATPSARIREMGSNGRANVEREHDIDAIVGNLKARFAAAVSKGAQP